MARGARADELTPLAAERARDAERPLLVRPFLSWSVMAFDNEHARLRHDPVTALGASIGWKRLKLTVSKAVNLIPDDPEDDLEDGPKLNSDALNLSLAISLPVRGRELVLTPFYSSVKGIEVEVNPVLDNLGNPGADMVQRPNMYVRSFGVDAVYCLNPNYSYNDRLLDFKPREHSSATFLLKASLGGVTLSPDGRSLGDTSTWAQDRPLARATAFDASYVGTNVGFSYQWLPVGRLAVMGLFVAGGTFSNARVSFADGRHESGFALRPTYSGTWGLGYVGDTVHFGLIGAYIREVIAVGDDDVTILRLSFLAHLGLRL